MGPAFEAEYAKPGNGIRSKPPILVVAMTWLCCSTFFLLLPASSRPRKATTEYQTATVLTFSALENSLLSVSHRNSWYCWMVGSYGMNCNVGPLMPELAIKTLMKPSDLVICSTMLARSSFFVTSPCIGRMFPCFCMT